ncbi:MAG: hypothetical protein A4E50_01059 [Methanosaeta sp. PtaB.Bin087]|nr:MAG: hypothetical protein A4E50_01059 [Methanosaeta sp. PtaB.Bin087]OPY51772.1 MAG: hypothetical protein A4E51_01469 [Methanosaeta sp. PtaU1.Bin055]HOI68213.1 hypothetical protein [Methanothrix sp.]
MTLSQIQPGKYTNMGHTRTISAPPNIIATDKAVRTQLRMVTYSDKHSLLSIPISPELPHIRTWADVFTQKGLQKAPDTYVSASVHGGGLALVIPTVRPQILSLARVEIHPKIQELASEDKLLDNILYDIVQDVNTYLESTEYKYKISVDFSKDFEDPEWINANVVILIKGGKYDQILDLWEDVSSKVDEYFTRLRRKTETDPNKINELNHLRDFINIRFISEE